MLGSFFVPCDYLERLAPELMAVPLLDLLSPPAPWLGCSLYTVKPVTGPVFHISRDYPGILIVLISFWSGMG